MIADNIRLMKFGIPFANERAFCCAGRKRERELFGESDIYGILSEKDYMHT